MAEVSKTVGDRLVFSDAVVQAIEVQGEHVTSSVTRSVGGSLPAGLLLDVFARWLAQTLRASSTKLREADLAHALELADDPAARRARDDANTALRGVMIRTSSLVRGAYDVPFSESVGLEAALESRPDMLLTQSTNAARLLARATAPTTGTVGATVDLTQLARELDARVAALRAGLEGVKREEREAQQTLSQRDAALAEWSRVYGGVGEIFAGLATLAGLDDLASKLRPTTRRQAGIPDVPSTPTEPGTPA
jgi:hypothetical protein